ncbi:MAG: hypothetical protein E7674_00605 [Ruminococcaceae bacterium]|nr:hypothetical protein [Oscillospiraceae bacterium]
MKKIALMVLCLLLAVSLFSCTTEDANNNSQSENGTQSGSKYVFNVASKNNYTVKLDMNMKEVLEALGEPLSYFEAASCAFDGLDKTYTYAGFQILTRPDGDKDYINSIILTDDSVTTPEGVYIGVTEADVTAEYGTPAQKTDTLLSYTDGGTALNFILKNGTVISIEYIPA